jgi:hypothetical protein
MVAAMKSIALQFSYQTDLSAELIAYFGHGAGFSHVDVVLADGRLLGARDEACETIAAGVQIRPADYARFTRKLVVTIATDTANAQSFDTFLRAQLGKPYDLRAIIGFALGRDWRESDSWFCSELVAAALETAKIFPYRLATPANKIDPDDLLLALSVIAPLDPGEGSAGR